jgi:hypothetical protein
MESIDPPADNHTGYSEVVRGRIVRALVHALRFRRCLLLQSQGYYSSAGSEFVCKKDILPQLSGRGRQTDWSYIQSWILLLATPSR